jgi:acetyl-CoA carboxylase carboxyl transferase subunit beta
MTGFMSRRETPDNLWTKCRGCGAMVYSKEYEENLSVCPRCDHHERIGPQARFAQIFDGPYTPVAVPKVAEDPLRFRDQKRYVDRLRTARQTTGEPEAMTVGDGSIGGTRAIVAIQNFAFMGGSMGMGVGEAFLAGAQAAVAAGVPFIVFTAAGGARMQEGILSLMQMPRTTVGIAELKEAGLPYIVVLTDPTTGGVTASYAMLGDVQIAEPNALIGFAGQRVIEQTIREKLPEGFQRAEYLLEHGMLDMVVHRKDMKATLARLLALLMARRRAVQEAA